MSIHLRTNDVQCHHLIMRSWFMFCAGLTAFAATGACSEAVSPPLPSLAIGATTTGGSNSLCEPGYEQGSTPETASHSTEINQRLNRDFPPGSPAVLLRRSLVRQGFQLNGACSPDHSVWLATFRQRGGNGITAFPAFVSVYWKEDSAARIVWASGDVAWTGL